MNPAAAGANQDVRVETLKLTAQLFTLDKGHCELLSGADKKKQRKLDSTTRKKQTHFRKMLEDAIKSDHQGFQAGACLVAEAMARVPAARRSIAGISIPAACASSFTASMKGSPR